MDFRNCKGLSKSRSSRSNPAKRVLFLGLPKVGKSTIMKKLCDVYSNSATMPSGFKPAFHLNLVEERSVDAPCLRRLSIATADAIVLTYAVDDIDSFQYVATLLDEITEIKGPNFALLVVANKADIEVSVIDRIIEDCIIFIDYGYKQIDTIANADTDSGILEISELLLKYITNIIDTTWEQKSSKYSAFLRPDCLNRS